MDDCFCIYNGKTAKFVLSFFFQFPPIVNWKVIFLIFQKKVLFFVFFFTFSICGRSQKNSFFFNFFRKTWKNFKVIFSKFMHFWHHMLRILTFFCTKKTKKVPIATGTENLVFFKFFLKNVFTIGGGQFFFCFSNKKISIQHPYEGGGSKSPFLKTRLWDY